MLELVYVLNIIGSFGFIVNVYISFMLIVVFMCLEMVFLGFRFLVCVCTNIGSPTAVQYGVWQTLLVCSGWVVLWLVVLNLLLRRVCFITYLLQFYSFLVLYLSRYLSCLCWSFSVCSVMQCSHCAVCVVVIIYTYHAFSEYIHTSQKTSKYSSCISYVASGTILLLQIVSLEFIMLDDHNTTTVEDKI